MSLDVPALIHRLERAILLLIIALTVGAVGLELLSVLRRGTIVIADILLLFLYTEVISMVGVFYVSRVIPVLYPLFIAITALSRLIVLQSKDMAPQTILFEAAAILVLGVAAVALNFAARPQDLSFGSAARKEDARYPPAAEED